MNGVAVPLLPDEHRFKEFLLEGILPPDCLITCDRQLRLVTLQCRDQEGRTHITEQQEFSELEFEVVMLFFETYPIEFVSHAEMFSVYTGQSLDDCIKAVNRAWDEGDIDPIAKPVRNLVHRTRFKLRSFGLDIRSILHTGYRLMLDESRRR